MEKQTHSEAAKEEFQCKIDGCTESFPSELHRNVHTKKHDLNLSLELPSKGPGGLFSDQTPTPTRLIGKCEEVGLFEDLQKVNPFDETFRRAVESATSSGSSLADDQSPGATILTVPGGQITEGETLHTPHIFPSTIDRSAQDTGPTNVESSVTKQRPKMKSRSTEQRSGKRFTPVKRKTPTVVDILPKPPVFQPPIISEPIPLIIIPSGSTDKKLATPVGELDPVLVKEKLKEHLTKVRESSLLPKEVLLDKKRFKEYKNKSNKPSKPIDLTKVGDEQADLKHERWKAAAKRYRMRVKKSQDQQHQRNMELEEENMRLRTELTELKHAHHNCSVTREQRMKPILIHDTSQNLQTQPISIDGGAQESGLTTGVQPQVGTVSNNSAEQQPQQQQPLALSTPQQRLITSHIVDGHSFNRAPILIVFGPTGETVATALPDALGYALAGGCSQNT